MKRSALLLACAILPLASAAAPLDEQTARLARERGCALCHAFEPVKRGADAAPPPAPAWRDIAARYRGKPGAEDKLVAVVMRGTNPADRHWAGKASVVDMPPNPVAISEDEARTIVRWILRLD
jgi:cytochrome c